MIIGITGRAGAGKDTVAGFLRDNHRFALMSFADPIKRMINELLGTNMQDWQDRVWKERVIPDLGVSPREMAQTLGTEWGRNCCGKNFWVKIALGKAQWLQQALANGVDNYDICFTDVRFENEAEAIRIDGGYIIHVVRPGRDDATEYKHSSEDGFEPHHLDVILVNDGTLEDLEEKVNNLFFGGKRKVRDEAI